VFLRKENRTRRNSHALPSSFAAGKTDYRARRRLVVNDKNKYQSPRYRLVVRLTNHYVICQIMYTEIDGDKVLTSAYSSELARYGVKVGLKNYAACYCTGLLVARRLLDKLGMADLYKGNTTITGEVVTSKDEKSRDHWVAKVEEGRLPFKCVLDVGIRPTTTGHRVFGAMKGAVDGGLDIPHNEKRFPGYSPETKKYDSKFHRARIYGLHLQDYMQTLEEEEPETFAKRFSQFAAAGLQPDSLEAMYKAAHAAIRKDPKPSPKSSYKPDTSFAKPGKRSLEDRKAAIAAKKAGRIAQLQKSAAAAGGDDEDED
jgi:large subunit ribosomal protein L5e